jgi:hypothetical protein
VRVNEVVVKAGAVREQYLERNRAGRRLEQGDFAVVGKAGEDLLNGELGRDGGQVVGQGQGRPRRTAGRRWWRSAW